ncbi:MAG: MFS transporter [Muribaculaceae bacterium]|nr:MFS transporter [Muribaculaceae bacterium]
MATVVNNMFSPAMPSLVQYFGSTEQMVQGGFAAGMLGLSLGTLLWGILSDALGRRRLLLLSTGLFVVGTACMLPVKSLSLLIALRFVQGFTAAGCIAISRSVATDSFAERQLLKAMAVINVVNGIMPIVAPMVGGTMAGLYGWQGVFAVMLGVGALLFVGTLLLKESLPAERRNNRTFSAIVHSFVTVVSNRRYVSMLLHQACAEVLLFGNLASAAFIAMHYGWGDYIGIVLAVNGIFIGVGAAVAGALPSAIAGVRTCCCGILVMSVVVAAMLVLDCGFIPYEIAVCLMLCFMGMTLTSSTTIALESTRDNAGTASSLFVASGFLVGGLVAPLLGIGDMLHSVATAFVCGAVLSSLFALLHPRSK